MKFRYTLPFHTATQPARMHLFALQVIVVSIGPKQSIETIRTALAMGADRGM